jgi:hypothetical protein
VKLIARSVAGGKVLICSAVMAANAKAALLNNRITLVCNRQDFIISDPSDKI